MTSKAGYWLGGGLLVLAVGSAIVYGVLSFRQFADGIDSFERVAIPGRETLALEARKYVVYIEGARAAETPPQVEVAVVDSETRRRLPIEPYAASATYMVDGTAGSAIATVTPPHAGDYVLHTGGQGASTGYEIAIGDSIAGRIVRTVLVPFVLAAVLGIPGIALIVVTAVRRSRTSREHDAPAPAPAP